MSPVMQKTVSDVVDQMPHDQVFQDQTEGYASWFQWDVNKYPSELISRIVSCLGCKDIGNVRATCKSLKAVVETDHYETFFYTQFPKTFRKQYPQSLSWQKRMIKNHLHPFTSKLPNKMAWCFDADQQAAILCFNTLRNMMITSRYQALEVFSCPFPTSDTRIKLQQVEFSLTSSDLLLYDVSSENVRLLGQSGAGSWSGREVDRETHPGFRQSAVSSVDCNERYMSIISSDNIRETFTRRSANAKWKSDNRSLNGVVNSYLYSVPGKYTAIITSGYLECIMCFDDQGQWVPMPIAKNARINTRVSEIRFSPSEQQLAIGTEDKLIILSPDSQGCWNLSGKTIKNNYVDYTEKDCFPKVDKLEFSPSGDCLLADVRGCKSVSTFALFIILRPDPAGEWHYFQSISYQGYRLFFSPTGRYLLGWEGQELVASYELQECGKWGSCRNLMCPEASASQELWPLKKHITIAFSGCDNYRCTHSGRGLVVIWGWDKSGYWTPRGIKHCDGEVSLCNFSQSGVHALTVDRSSIFIWGRNEDGLWSVKETIPATDVRDAYFHPAAEHLIVFWNLKKLWIWEIRKENQEPVWEQHP